MKKTFIAVIMMFTLFVRECQAQPPACGAASFYLYGNYQNDEILLHFIGINGSTYSGNGQGYLYTALNFTNASIGAVVAQVVAVNGVSQDGPSTFLAPNSAEFQSVVSEALISSAVDYWYFQFGGQTELNLEQNDFQQVYDGSWVQELGVDAAFWVNLSTVIGPVTDDLSSLLGDANAATQAGNFMSLFQDATSGFSGLQSAFGNNAPNIVGVLEEFNVVTNQNYSSAQLIIGLAALNPSQLAQFESDLYAAAYPGTTLKPSVQQFLTTFLKNAGAGAEQLGASAAFSGAEAFYEAYALAQFPASASAETAASQAGTYFVDGLPGLAAWSAASTVMQAYVTPQADILQDIVYCENVTGHLKTSHERSN
jgi:hypothetical protein